MTDIQRAPIEADRQHGGPVGGRYLGLAGELAGFGVDSEGHDLVLVLETNVQSIWHLFPPSGLRSRAILVPQSTTMSSRRKAGRDMPGFVTLSFQLAHDRYDPLSGQLGDAVSVVAELGEDGCAVGADRSRCRHWVQRRTVQLKCGPDHTKIAPEFGREHLVQQTAGCRLRLRYRLWDRAHPARGHTRRHQDLLPSGGGPLGE